MTQTIITLFALFCVALAGIGIPLFRTPTLMPQAKVVMFGAIALFMALTCSAFYATLGKPDLVPQLAARETEKQKIQIRISKLMEDIRTEPKNAIAWAELGTAQMISEDFNASASAYKRAVVLSEGNPIFILQYAKALTFAADGTVTPEAEKSFDMVLNLLPDNSEAQYFKALSLYQHNEFKQARTLLNALKKEVPENSPLHDAVQTLDKKL